MAVVSIHSIVHLVWLHKFNISWLIVHVHVSVCMLLNYVCIRDGKGVYGTPSIRDQHPICIILSESRFCHIPRQRTLLTIVYMYLSMSLL